jgi:hypothetical protein
VNAEDLDVIRGRRALVIVLSERLDSTSPLQAVWQLLDVALDSSDDVDVLLGELALRDWPR